MSGFSDFIFEAELVARSIGDYFSGAPLRLGVTGLSRAGKTVFLTALVNNLIAGARLPVLAASAEGRIKRVRLEPQPDDAVPRFAYEEHLKSLSGQDRHWPESTRRIAQLRLTIEFESASGWGSRGQTLTVDIVDFPGEWLLDLPLLDKSYAEWSRETLAASENPARAPLAEQWRAAMVGLDPAAEADEDHARRIAELFTAYLKRARDDVYALSTLPPGRFLMPGDLAGSPALTFAPIPLNDDATIAPGSLPAMMARRYEAYKAHVARPFFRDHFARLDRQIVLVDALSALNSGPAAVKDLENALTEVMRAFRAGRSSYFASVFRPRIDRILFAATKADHLHHKSHDRLEAILRALSAKAIARAEGVGAEIDVIALAAVRATREAEIRTGGETLDAIIGVPEKGETIGGQTFDGIAEAAVFPGELPADPDTIFEGDAIALPEADNDWRFVRFRPPLTQRAEPAPQIRLDRALQFLIGDRPRVSQRLPRPRAFRLDDSRIAVDDQPGSLIPEAIIRSQNEPIPVAQPAPIDEAELEVEAAQKSGLIARSRLTLGGLVWTGLGGLISLGLGLWATNLIEGLFAKAESLGIIGVVFGLVFLVGLIGLAAREILAVARQTRVAEMHVALANARAADDRAAARRLVGQLVALYRNRPETARARAQVEEATRAIIDGRDLIDVAERSLLRPLDDRAQGEIAAAAKRVSLVTAISPRAILDVVFVVAQIVRLVRRIAEIYGGRPGLLGLIKLARSIGAHIAITGGMAVGDSLLQQVVGHGIASRISARMGEGVLNGMLTTRVGLSALAVCRPMPFSVDKPPGVSDVAPFLFSKGEEKSRG